MKVLRILLLWLLLFAPAALFAQPGSSEVLLNAGKYVPPENFKNLSIKDVLFTQSLFAGKNYVVIQFYNLPAEATKNKLENLQIKLVDYLPRNAYTAILPANFSLFNLQGLNIRSIFILNKAQKSSEAIRTNQIPDYATKQTGYADVSVILYPGISNQQLLSATAGMETKLLEDMPMFRTVTLRIKKEKLSNLLALPFVQWVEPVEAPVKQENLLGRSLHRANVLNDGIRNLKGNNINIGIWDGGEVSPHLDFLPANRLTLNETSAPSDHSTHCAGTLVGKGLINPKARGMAPNAKLYSYNFNGNIQTEMFSAIPDLGLSISSHSYGSTQTCGVNGAGVAYSSTSRNTDINLNTYPNHLHVHSSGNSQTACTGGWSTITGSGKSAKNNILVGNITSTEGMSSTSSFGPVQDGRVKPEITSFGTGVLSTYLPLNAYGTISGTSMATPGVAGTLALLVERYRQLNGNAEPSSALIKNITCNAAQDLGNVGPDYKFGYGRINALAAVKILEDNRYLLNSIATAATNNSTITIPPGTAKLRVMITWNDPAGTANAALALVNDLDLKVTDPAATEHLPWVLNANNPGNGAYRDRDTVSNIEQVTIDNPAAGNYIISVNGKAIAVGATQNYTLTWIIDPPTIEVTYPNGKESFSPGTSETITWGNPGINGNQTVAYSIDGGTNWTNISTVGPGVTRLAWTPPTANTSTALIKVSSGSVNDVSDAGFNILGTVTGLNSTPGNCSTGSLNFTWNAVANATQYDIYKLDTATAEWVIMGANVVGTTYIATGLVDNSSMWFTIVAKNNISNAVSERALAINRQVTSAGGLGNLGAISGATSVCTAVNNIVYTIPAITGTPTYTWTVPAGAGIISGQGTTSITVNYAAATAGNITVVASSGSCQTSVSSLAISSSNAGISAPVSGGNQSVTACLSGTIPTLTATATVPAGFTIIWYDAAAAGNVVANPAWQAAGSKTYYAAAKSTATGCESVNRTAVFLTISEAAPASVTASGNLSFCQGSSVTLTANTGSSYLWSTGANTQSITVSTAGTYTVAVTQGTCTSTSPAQVVTVNSLPVATITAAGPTSFCDGNSVQLTASAGSSYLWNTGATTQSITVNTANNYTVKVTNATGCNSTSSATTITVLPQPTVSLSAAPYTKLYPGLTTTLTANVSPAGAYSYVWKKDGAVISASTNSLSVSGANLGSYSVSVSNVANCSNTSAALNISDSVSSRLFVYPNPSTGRFNVSYYSSAAGQFGINIYDSKGAKVYEKTYNVTPGYQPMPVVINRNSKGIYRLVLTDKNGKKIAVENILLQ